jgi:RHS repeat-associated protein
VWSGQEKVEFRDATDAVTQRNYAQGQYVGTTAYFYTRDHLGSVREMFTGGGTVVARYDYDPYGRSTTVLGTTPTDFNFTGLYRHSKSNLDLATYRAYDPDLGRWLSRDPIGETGGLNLYGYTRNNPLNSADLSGLCPPTLNDAKELADDAARWLLWDIANTYDWLNAQFFDTFGFPLEQAAPQLSELSALRALPAITDVATAGRVLSEGDAILAVVQDGKIIAQSGNLLLSHEQFVARTVGTLQEGAEVVTIGKINGQVLAITSKSFHGHQIPASASAQKAALGAFR